MVQDCRCHDMTLVLTDRERQKELFFASLTTDSCVIFMPTGPLPEPVINGGMEEKVRFTSSTNITETDAR